MTEAMADPEDAAAKEIDAYRLLPGELEDSVDPVEITRWANVYEDLLSFKRGLMGNIHSQLDGRLPEVRQEIQDVDVVALEAELKRIERRRDFWRARLH